MSNTKLVLVILGVLGATVLGVFVLRGRSQAPLSTFEPVEVQSVEVGKVAPALSLTDFSGNTQKLSDYKGKAVVLDFWAGWCPFCVAEMPELQAAADKYGDRLVILGIHRTATEAKSVGERFAKDRGVSYPLIVDPQDLLYRTFSTGISAMPLAVFIDKEGVVRDIKFGPKTAEEIQQKVASLIE